MTESEARIFFPFDEDEDLDDLYEDRFFEYKQFFLTKAIVGKVFRAKLEKLLKFEKAFTLISQKEYRTYPVELKKFSFSKNVLESYLSFETQKGDLKRKIGQATNAFELSEATQDLIRLVHAYYQMWNRNIEINVEIDSISKEPDSMMILRAIRAFESAGGKTFSDIVEQNNNLELLKEMKRVSLLLQKFD